MKLKNLIFRILSSLTFWHVLFWLFFCFVFSIQFITGYTHHGKLEFSKLIPLIAYGINLTFIIYLNYFVLLPRLLSKKSIWHYFLTLSIAFITIGISFSITYYWLAGVYVDMITFVSFILLQGQAIIITSFFKFLKEWIENKGLQLKVANIEQQRTEAELSALKSQLNPHFLFNVLNNIYSHSLLKSDLTPTIVLKLSDLLSYILYDCKNDKVPLQNEVEFIRNYFELEQIRLEENVDIDININNINYDLISPLLFIPLIDNAFKHGIGSHPKNRFISLTIDIIDNTFYFNLVNSKGITDNIITDNAKGGIGIENVRKRLDLLYPNKHKMKISNEIDKFSIEIIINDFRE